MPTSTREKSNSLINIKNIYLIKPSQLFSTQNPIHPFIGLKKGSMLLDSLCKRNKCQFLTFMFWDVSRHILNLDVPKSFFKLKIVPQRPNIFHLMTLPMDHKEKLFYLKRMVVKVFFLENETWKFVLPLTLTRSI